MWFRLAALWGCTVREAQSRCLADEFIEWIAFATIEPFGGRRGDWQAAIIAHAVIAAAGGKTKISDHLLDWSGEPAEPMSATAMEQQLDLIAAMTGGTVKK